MTAPRVPPAGIRVAISAIAWFNLISALVGMGGLTLGGGMGLPAEWLEGSVFASYFWPGVILGVVVGGAQAAALATQYRRLEMAWGMHAAAGLIMVIWIFVEVALLLVWSPLHAVFFSSGVIQIVLAVLALGAWPKPLLRRGDTPPPMESD